MLPPLGPPPMLLSSTLLLFLWIYAYLCCIIHIVVPKSTHTLHANTFVALCCICISILPATLAVIAKIVRK